jgi:voltage-gated sodium channel
MRSFRAKLSALIISETAVITVVVINSAALVISSSITADSGTVLIWRRVDLVCVIYFVVEALLKIRSGGWKEYWSSGWNRFDFIIVLLSLPVLFEGFLEVEGFAAILILRLGRLLRLFRLMRFIPNRDHLAKGIGRALRASIGVFFSIFIVNVIFAVGATILFGSYAPEHFGDPFLAIYSTFKVFTVEGWYEIPDQIALSADSLFIASAARLYFVLTVVVGGILGLSLANAVFIDEMTMDNNNELERKIDLLSVEIRELKNILTSRPQNNGNPGEDIK